MIPSKPSFAVSAFGVISNVAEVSPAARVTVPDRETISAESAFVAEPPRSSPTTLYVNVVAEVDDAEAVTVYVIELPSATVLALAEREYETLEPTEVPEIVPPVQSEIVEPVGRLDTPIAEANPA